MNSPEPRVALVTGANRGSGRSIAAELHRRGYRVFCLNRTLTGDDLVTEFACDLADPGQIEAAVQRVLEQAGSIDVCISNAVERVLEPIAAMEARDWDRMLAVNLSASFHLTRAVLPALRVSRGQIVFMGSHAGTHYFEGGVAYSATKAAMAAFVETLLLEERRNGVRACLVSPGAIANLDGDESPHKMAVDSIGRCIGSLVDFPSDVVVGEIEIRPASPLQAPITGIDRLLYV
ncbi:short-chain dehydrogenase [Streptomyces sp. WM4235]|uniref:SDR family oxidoreductase n=1 Tax=Streptomyces sp. WM4235 TaxID=1415551 RepID=UPI0006AFE8C1|nr:SDR family NAD(P)-dependent oxidoreductase [Streptomyces sp. WM4235]KOU52240.1 short-chain dehydrogenase [Streptomyces sp. WM4235]